MSYSQLNYYKCTVTNCSRIHELSDTMQYYSFIHKLTKIMPIITGTYILHDSFSVIWRVLSLLPQLTLSV
jgi:hypothetical protein